jgi:phage tail-like protein
MRPPPPTFWLLDGRTGWRTGTASDVSVGSVAGLRLAVDPGGPLAPNTEDLGGRTLPQDMAIGPDGILHLLDRAGPWVAAFDPPSGAFVRLPGLGGAGSDARSFRDPAAIAIAGDDLYVADRGNGRVLVFALRARLALRHVWGLGRWDPADVTAHGGAVFILDAGRGRVYHHHPWQSRPRLLVDAPAAAGRWTRLAVDRDRRVHLLDPTAAAFDVYAADGRFEGRREGESDERDRFDPPPVRRDHRGRFCLPPELARLCDRRPGASASLEWSLGRCLPGEGGLLFDRAGRRVELDDAEPAGPRPFVTGGTWISAALDSDLDRCQWHRLELDLPALPAGTRVTVSTFADQRARPDDEIAALPAAAWGTPQGFMGEATPPDAPASATAAEFAVQSVAGRYLWVRVELAGDGYVSPAVGAIRAHYPRESYLSYLPAVYEADEESRRFMERFLAIFQTEWEGLEQTVHEVERCFDPDAVPPGPLLAELARWLALPLEGDWDDAQRRRLLAAAPALVPLRGTLEGVRGYLRVYLENMTGLDLAGGGYPEISEGFRERARLLLGLDELSELGGPAAPLWSPDVVGRLQLDVVAREGEVRMVSTGDPERDLFHEHAHRFRVFVPAAWVRTATDEEMVRRAVDAEKPAHADYALCLVEPRLQVGVQSTVGLDTIVGAHPLVELACADGDDSAPSRAPRGRLGLDTVIGGAPASPTMRLEPGPRRRPAPNLT